MADEQKANVVLTADNRQYDRAMQSSAQATNQLFNSVVALSTGLNVLAQRTGKKLELVSAAGLASLTAATVSAAKFDSQMSTMQASAIMTGRSVDLMAKNVNALRGSFAVTTDQAIALQTQLAKLGQTAGIDKMSASLLKLGAVTGESVGALTQGMVGLQRQMGTTGSAYTEKFSSALANASAKAGVAATSVLDFSNAIAPIAKVAGMSTKEVMGFSTAFAKAGQDGGAATTAFTKMLTDITRSVQYGSPELKAYSNLIGVSVKQFKEMPRSESVIRIFEEISKQGPDAIKTLERFGLDGTRTFKALQAMANQGGIRSAMKDVSDGYGDTTKFNKAATAAMDGMNDQLQKLGNNLSRIGQAFGSAFVDPLQKVISALNAVMAPLAAMLEGLGKIPGLSALAGSAVVGMSGLIIRHFAGLTGLALFRTMFSGGAAAGFRTAREGTNAPQWAQRASRTVWGGGGGALQRWAWGAGARVGDALGPKGERTGPGAISRLLSTGVRGVGWFGRTQLDGLQPSQVWNPMNRSTLIQSPTLKGAAEVGWDKTKATASNLFKGNAANNNLNASASAAAASLNQTAKASATQAGLFRTLASETGALTMAMGKASIGAGMMGVEGAAKLGPTLGRGLMSAGKGLMGFMGGPVGLAIGAGALGLAAYHQDREETKSDLQLGEQAEASDAAGGAYRVALGEAARATTTFADIVKRNAVSMDPGAKEKPGVISDEMYKEAKKPGHKYTDERIASMTVAQAKSYVQSTSLSDEAKKLLGYDLAKRFDQKTAQGVLDSQTSMKGSIETEGLFSGMKGREHWYWGTNSEASRQATKQAAATGQANLADIQGRYGDRSAAQYQIASLNSAGESIAGHGHTAQNFSAIASMLGIDANDEKSRKEFEKLFKPVVDGDTFSAASVMSAKRMLGQGKYDSAFASAFRGVLDTAGGTADLASTRWDPSRALSEQQRNPLNNISESMQSNINYSGQLGRILMGNNASGQQINAAVGSQGDANLQQKTVMDMANTAVAATGQNFTEASSQLQKFKDAVGDASDPLYQLANAAQAAVEQRQSEAMHYMTRAGVAGQVGSNLRDAQRAAANAPVGGESDAQARLERARQAGVGQLQGGYDYFKNLYVQMREFNIGQKNALYDFNLQRSQSDHDFYLNRDRQEEDFNRSRKRQEDSYGRQLGRQVRDYNRQRGWAQEAFNKQRLRSEEDYQHQVVLMTEQAAKQIYNIYERVSVQRTWSAQNLMQNAADQQQRMQQQTQNLGQLRGMGISGDVIKMLGLNESQNAQQLARFLADLMDDPAMVKQWNDMAKARLKASKAIVTDEDNTQWQEMERAFKLNAHRAVEDFGVSMNQQAISFKTGLNDMRAEYNISVAQAEDDYSRARARQMTDYNLSVTRMVTNLNTQMTRAKDALNRSVEEITLSMDELADAAIKGLTGTAAKQARTLKATLDQTAKDVKNTTKTLITDVANLFKNWNGVTGVTSGGMDKIGQGTRQGGGQTVGAADGGYISGWSPHPKADNIPARLTAGEYVHKVDAVSHYGQGFMDAVNNKRFPKEAAQHFSGGGLVQFGKRLQGMDYDVSEHPQFGGVHPVHAKNSWHYKAGAIDVNHDQGSEKAAINSIISMARAYGLRTIWQVADHFDHAHFDIGSGPDMIGPGVPTGARSQGQDPILDAVKKLKSYKKWESIRGANYGLNKNIPKGVLAEIIAQSFMPTGSGDLHMPAPTKGNAGANASLGRTMAAARGWTGPQWEALNWIYMKESGWNQFADNPTSDAYGIPQALPGNKMASAGADWKSNPATQIKWGLGYIAERYGNPLKAQEFWKAHNWYGDGAIFAGGGQKVTGVGERGPEVILPLDQRGVDYLLAVMRQFSGPEAKAAVGVSRGVPCQSHGATNYYSRIDRSTQIHGPITVQSQDPRDMLRKLEGEKRIAALTSPRRSS